MPLDKKVPLSRYSGIKTINRYNNRVLQNFEHAFHFRFILRWGLLAVLVINFAGCTTLDFEPPSRNEDVYRIQVENLSNTDVTYSPQLSLYYIDGKKNIELPNGTLLRNGPAQLIAESEEGTYGVSVDVRFSPGDSSVRLFLEKGTGTGDNFIMNEVVESKTGSGAVFIRFGDYY